MSSPTIRDLAWLKSIPQSSAVLRASPSVQARVAAELPFPKISCFADIPAATSALIVAGGAGSWTRPSTSARGDGPRWA
jgi:hypothetical protein